MFLTDNVVSKQYVYSNTIKVVQKKKLESAPERLVGRESLVLFPNILPCLGFIQTFPFVSEQP